MCLFQIDSPTYITDNSLRRKIIALGNGNMCVCLCVYDCKWVCLCVGMCVCVCVYILYMWKTRSYVSLLFIYQTICSCCISHTHFPRILNLMPNLMCHTHTHKYTHAINTSVCVCKFLKFKNSKTKSSQQSAVSISARIVQIFAIWPMVAKGMQRVVFV